MQWWNDFVAGLYSEEGWRFFTTVILPFVAIVVAGILAALIARTSTRQQLNFQNRELKAAAVMALIGAGRKASVWNSLGGEEMERIDNQLGEADVRVRLLPVSGVSAAADWAAHQVATMKKDSANFTFQAEQTFIEYRDRLLEWQRSPKRARKLFAYDLDRWALEADEQAREQGRDSELDFQDSYETRTVTPTESSSSDAAAAEPIAAAESDDAETVTDSKAPGLPRPVPAGDVRRRIDPEPSVHDHD